MPVKRRTSKLRIDPEREFFIWSAVFSAGYDFFDELPELGLPSIERGTVPADWAREPWSRLGARYLDERRAEKRNGPIWAEEQFGRPWENDDAH